MSQLNRIYRINPSLAPVAARMAMIHARLGDRAGNRDDAIARGEGIVKVIGALGTGKTLPCRMVTAEPIETRAGAYIINARNDADWIVGAVLAIGAVGPWAIAGAAGWPPVSTLPDPFGATVATVD